MSSGSKALASALLIAFAATAAADEVVLKDGRVLKTSKPLAVKGKQAILTLADRSVVSVSLSEIDQEKTAARKAASAAPAPAPVATERPKTAADAVRMKGGRKATVVLTDDDVGRSGGAEETVAEPGGALIQVGSVSTTQIEGGGVKFEGSVQNTGQVEANAVSVTIELVGEDNKTIASTYASLAKDNLTPGEKTTFTAQAPAAPGTKIVQFRYVPSWKERKREGAAPAAGEAEKKEEAEATPTPKPTPPPAPPPPPSRPDVAAPAPNAPVGEPSQPGGAYLPQPSGSGQPKPPGGGI